MFDKPLAKIANSPDWQALVMPMADTRRHFCRARELIDAANELKLFYSFSSAAVTRTIGWLSANEEKIEVTQTLPSNRFKLAAYGSSILEVEKGTLDYSEKSGLAARQLYNDAIKKVRSWLLADSTKIFTRLETTQGLTSENGILESLNAVCGNSQKTGFHFGPSIGTDGYSWEEYKAGIGRRTAGSESSNENASNSIIAVKNGYQLNIGFLEIEFSGRSAIARLGKEFKLFLGPQLRSDIIAAATSDEIESFIKILTLIKD